MFTRLVLALVFLMSAPQIAHAESKCQGMTKAQAERDKDCIWVKSYTRDDGTKVDGYARMKPSSDGKNMTKKTLKKETKKKDKKKEVKKDDKPKKEKKVKKEKKEKTAKKDKKPKKETKKKDKKKDKKS